MSFNGDFRVTGMDFRAGFHVHDIVVQARQEVGYASNLFFFLAKGLAMHFEKQFWMVCQDGCPGALQRRQLISLDVDLDEVGRRNALPKLLPDRAW